MQSRLRSGEELTSLPQQKDAELYFIGRIRTPWTERESCPRQGQFDGSECRIEIFATWAAALEGIEHYTHLEVLYWLDRSRRDLVRQNPKGDGQRYFGTFALRSPQRPNPIGTSKVRLVDVGQDVLIVRGLDCLDGTPLIDIKPDRCEFTPKAPPKPGMD
ncbi:tRNA (N6-threonylcarbamoyladenosine(37)-N6)-methyltransferase TrmO [uncultured Roseovarius sp.]|uniref:tRNA (N6-threonylcarbamoyladenosine(37)-N6)-methyltransferase TrmO n=1 Tax=uncultured Roseovarius sp. TaxID=293344 RepID=UPI00260DD82B|nr:tRNA (N6-threonylcarbamoyladenosine(37)-N6)-methyltransferase TrmO [uncultured Roseovarius sp.]